MIPPIVTNLGEKIFEWMVRNGVKKLLGESKKPAKIPWACYEEVSVVVRGRRVSVNVFSGVVDAPFKKVSTMPFKAPPKSPPPGPPYDGRRRRRYWKKVTEV
mgnify:FL=1